MKFSSSILAEQLYGLDDRELVLLEWKLRWQRTARPKQLAPKGAWNNWGVLSGRGFGKTLLAANWLGMEAANDPKSYNFVIAPTHDDVRNTCFEGPTGLLSAIPASLVVDYNKSLQIITLDQGAAIRGFSATEPERLRGPQHHRGWGDEVASWLYADETYKMMKLGLRLGTSPRFCWTGTPKPLPIVKQLMAAANSIIVRGTTYENRKNLAAAFFDELKAYEGTKLERQELYGEIIEAEEDGIVARSQWKMWPANRPLPFFSFVVMSLDTAFTERTFDKHSKEPDPSGCSVWGVFEFEGKLHVMLLDRWVDYLGFPALMTRVKKERKNCYGEGQNDFPESIFGRPLITPDRPRIVAGGRPIDLIILEDKGSGISLRQALAAENILTHPYNPKRADKLSRLHAVSPMFAQGRIWAVESDKNPGHFRSWAEPLISCVCSFHGEGTVTHDEDVDTTTQALRYIYDNLMGSLTAQPVRSKEELAEEAARQLSMGNPYAQ